MKLLVISQYYPRNGSNSGVFIHSQNIQLRRLGVDLTVIAPTPWVPPLLKKTEKWGGYSCVPTKSRIDDIEVVYQRYPFLIPAKLCYWINAVSLYACLVRNLANRTGGKRFDAILARPLIPTGYTACLLARRLSVPVVCEATGSDVNVYPKYNRFSRMMFDHVLRHADRLIANSARQSDDINRYVGRDRCTAIYRGVDIKRFAPLMTESEAKKALRIDDKEAVILFVGSISRQKGVVDLMEAFAQMAGQEDGRAHLYLVGPANTDLDLTELSSRHRLNGQVHAVGLVPHADLPRWYNACRFTVLPSYGEGMPNVVFEAMACGKPVIATPVGGIPDVVQDAENGYIVPCGAPMLLADRMSLLLRDPRLAFDMGSKAMQTVRNGYDQSRQARKLADVLLTTACRATG